jgi:dihydroxy-acid dehydratase
MAGHVAPEAALGGPISAVREGDTIVMDVEKRELNVKLSDDEIAQRIAEYKSPPPLYTRGVLGKYSKHVSTASLGAVTN